MKFLPFRNFEIFVEIDIFSNLMNVFKFTNKSMGSVVPTLKNFKLVDTSGKRFQKCSEKWWQSWHQCDIITLALFLLVMSSTMVMHISKRKSGKYSRIFWKNTKKGFQTVASMMMAYHSATFISQSKIGLGGGNPTF